MTGHRHTIATVALLFTAAICTHARAADAPAVQVKSGTGFYISHDGYVLTANHVITNCAGDISLHNNTMVVKAKPVASNAESDLALLKIVPKLNIENISYLRSLSKPIKAGDAAVVVGYPVDEVTAAEFIDFSTNDGKVISDKGPQGNEKWMLFTYAAKSGFSGGPVLDQSGNIIGVTSGETCLSNNCANQFNQAITNINSATTAQQVNASADVVSQNSDTNIASSQSSIQKILIDNHVAYQQVDSVTAPTPERFQQIADSIVNIRCPVSDKEVAEGKRTTTISR